MANTDFENLKISMKAAVWDKEQTIIGKGIYTPDQLKSAIAEIESIEMGFEHAKILREALDDARQELEAQATYFGSHLSPENNLVRILRKLESTLEATKPEE